ncbi:MAG: GH92 family glycosyl hydrolase [Kiritimatiellae bacterium]|nr:GH92 family glycosyl hydrolase [Kiritimatiellia bacterium]
MTVNGRYGWVLLAGCLAGGTVGAAAPASIAAKADTKVGVVGAGSCMVGPCLPHASAYPSPDTLYPFTGRRFASPSGMFYGDPVTGFSQLHTQGTGGTPTYGLFLVSPATDEAYTEEELASPLRLQTTACHLFRGFLEKWGVAVTIAPAAHGAIYRFEFPETADARLVFNVARKIGKPEALASGSLTLDPEKRAVWGGGTYDGNWNPAPYQAYFYAVVDAAPQRTGTWLGNDRQSSRLTCASEKRTRMGGWMTFDTRVKRTVTMRIAVSFHSVEKARQWLEAEMPDWDLERLAGQAQARWETALGAVRIEGVDPKRERLFYSHLFHTMVQPRDRTGDFAGWEPSMPVWDDHYTLWDTWKTLFPLMAILQPETVAANVNAFTSRIRKNGACSTAFIQGREYRVGQGGDEADNIIGDAFAKGIPGIDWEGAWEVLAANANRRTPEYLQLGYVPSDVKTDYCNRMKSGSGTLGFAYNDWCAARVAAGLGKKEEAARLLARSANWTNVWDAAAMDGPSGFTGFIRARSKSGAFGVPTKKGIVPSDPRKGYNQDFYEGTPWEYSYVIPHDIPGMIERMGGKARFTERLQYALENRLIDFGNEPSFMTIWLFNFVDRPDLTAFWADRLRAKFTDDGIPGDDDSGAMGSLYVFLTAGFFPFAGQDLYALHGPSVERVEFRLPSGKRFTVIGRNAGGKNIYIRSVTLNGKPLDHLFIRHGDITAGGTLEFEMESR